MLLAFLFGPVVMTAGHWLQGSIADQVPYQELERALPAIHQAIEGSFQP